MANIEFETFPGLSFIPSKTFCLLNFDAKTFMMIVICFYLKTSLHFTYNIREHVFS